MTRPRARYRYITLDVFTDRPFGGNPLAVFPEAEGIDDRGMQAIAREFNLSETVFVLPGSDGVDANLRIFTPVFEMPFAGHPIVGASHVLSKEERIGAEATLGVKAGEVAVRIRGDEARITAPQPPRVLDGPAPGASDVASAVGLNGGDVLADGKSPTICSAGAEFLFACVASREALSRAVPGQVDHKVVGIALVALDDLSDGIVHMRMFAPSAGVPEDPATGSAASALPAYLRHMGLERSDFVVHQGEDMGRPSFINVSVATDAASTQRVQVGGGAVIMSEGAFLLG